MWHRSKSSSSGAAGPGRREPDGTDSSADNDLSDTLVMTMLEQRRADGVPHRAEEQSFSHVPVLRPEDTGTRRVLKEAVNRGDPVSFGVQLLWSPKPIDLTNTPRDPIFRSYTVYTTRVRHDGREWFELRLGFFADAISAKQVAHYMQSEYNSAAVVPVTPEEQTAARAAASAAKGVGNRPAGAAVAAGAPSPSAPSAARRPHLALIRRGGAKSA